MHSGLPKVAHRVAGRPLVAWVVEAAAAADPDRIVVVIGHGAELVVPLLPPAVITAVQEEQLGTGHATTVGLAALDGVHPDDTVLVLYGDMPLLTGRLIADVAARSDGVTARVVTTTLEDPTGYGRVLRAEDGSVSAVIEDRDCSPEQVAVKEVNAGVYAFRAGSLIDALGRLSNQNAQGEYYLTDVVGILVGSGERLEPVPAAPEEVVGINSQDELAQARRLLQERINKGHMDAGVWMLDPDRTYIDESVRIAPGARIYPGVHLEGETTVGPGATVGPDVYALDSTVGAGSTVWYAVLRGAKVGEDCEVGPFASLRPGTVLENGSKVGTFVETKNTRLGEGAKAPHLSYLGDATIGPRANIGAGAITCNYDGFEKHHTEIGEGAFIGSDTMLVAPVRVGDHAVTGAGSVISKDVPDGALAIERGDQREIPGYSQRRARRAKRAKD